MPTSPPDRGPTNHWREGAWHTSDDRSKRSKPFQGSVEEKVRRHRGNGEKTRKEIGEERKLGNPD